MVCRQQQLKSVSLYNDGGQLYWLSSFMCNVHVCCSLKLLILLYADKIVIMAESANDLLYALNEFFCMLYKMEIGYKCWRNKDTTYTCNIFKGSNDEKKHSYYNGDVTENVQKTQIA
jgi:hypothetical protein